MLLQGNLPWLVPANPERRTDRLQGSGTQAVGHVLSAAIMFFSATLLMKLLVQEFSSDLGCRTVKRIADVSKLRIYQFPQVFLICALSLHSNLLPNEINCSIMAFWPPCDFFPWYPGCWADGTSYSPPFLYQGINAQSFEFITLLLATSIRYSV